MSLYCCIEICVFNIVVKKKLLKIVQHALWWLLFLEQEYYFQFTHCLALTVEF